MEKTVLCVFGGRRRPATFCCAETAEEEHKNLIDVVQDIFSDVLSSGEGTSINTTDYFLQIESVEWGGLVDLSGYITDRATVHVCRSSAKSEVTKSSEKGKDICSRLGKPSAANASVLASLFPSCANSSKKRKFNPNDECVVADQHRRKKGSKGRSKILTVVVMNTVPATLPKGALRARLSKLGRVKDIPFQRHFDTDEVGCLIADEFSNLGSFDVRYLQSHKSNALTVAEVQEYDGVGVIKLAGGGSLYLQAVNVKSNPKNACTDESASTSHEARMQRAATVLEQLRAPVEVPSAELESLDQDKEEMTNVTSAGSSHTEDIHQWRQIRAEQDIAFQESLEADQAKENAQRVRTEWIQRAEELRDTLKSKFSVCDCSTSGSKIAFKLPDGSKADYVFPENAAVKNLYQYVVSKGVLPPFSLCVPHPSTVLSLAEYGDRAVAPYKDSILLVCPEDADHCDSRDLELLSDPMHDSINNSSCSSMVCEGETERKLFMEGIGVQGGIMKVDRSAVYDDVIDLYKNENLVNQYPIFVQFEGELAVDEGGVQRDMFSAFWENAYSRFFEGATTLVPMVHPQIDMSMYPMLGRISSHGYLASGILPDRIALPTLIATFLGPTVHMPSEVLMNAFMDYVSVNERQILKKALECSGSVFPPATLEALMSILSRFGCRQIPKPSTLIGMIEQVTAYEFCTKPAAAISLMNLGIPTNHKVFWNKKSPTEFQALHSNLSVSASKVIGMLETPSVSNPAEERVCQYLTTMIGNMQPNELRLFMRFVTGASVCIASKIIVTTNNVGGLARRPIAHTCDSTLELPVAYANYENFYADFEAILKATNDEFTWCMDAL